MRCPSAGRLFTAAIEPAGGVAAVAILLGCHRSHVWRLAHGETPGRRLAHRIEKVLGVPAAAWDAPE